MPNGVDSGEIQVILGPMFSGKTTELIRRLKRYKIAKYKCLIVRYAKDDRYSKTGIATHDRQELAAVSASDLASVKSMADKADVIGIDEGQFFPDCVNFSENMANSGKIIIVAALDGTFQRVGFGNILQLIPLAESIVKLKAVCMACFKDAAFTKRTTSQKELEVIGGEDMYMAVCRNCHHSPTTKTPSKFPLKECSNTPKIKSLSPSPKKQCTSSENRPVQVKRDLSVSLAMDLA